MIALIQRVTHANVIVDGQQIGNIDKGLLLLLGVEKADTEKNALELLNKVLNYRVFEDEKQIKSWLYQSISACEDEK